MNLKAARLAQEAKNCPLIISLEQFKALGLKPGNPNGTYTQEVPLAGIITTPAMTLNVGEKDTKLNSPDDYVASSARLQAEIKVENSDIVFVGYGVVAPEYGWDDYKDVDVRGKTILMLINDPADSRSEQIRPSSTRGCSRDAR